VWLITVRARQGKTESVKKSTVCALAKNRLPANSKDYPRSCFSQSIDQFDGQYGRLHSRYPDRGNSSLIRSLDDSSGLDKRFLQEDWRVFETLRNHVSLKRVCVMEAGQCAFKYVASGPNGEKLDNLMQEGSVLFPGHCICRPETDMDSNDGP